ncbi:MAG TPA: HisA/HisF-related TIM barrel protein [Pirellulales bacterium]|nr:HisA/HisF-related TIM barrel protein [Pirellulales bacterium]
MRVIPVLDIASGRVVRAIGGRRHEYRPIESRLCNGSEPSVAARSLAETFGFTHFYLADLDAIAGDEPAWDIYETLSAIGLKLWVDAGVGDTECATLMAGFESRGQRLERIVVGLESTPGPDSLGPIFEAIGLRAVFSLDLRHGEPLTTVERWQAFSIEEIADAAIAAGARSLIVLDLARVGEFCGVGTELICRQLHATFPEIELVAGGGVRNIGDLHALRDAGCSAALVASALHDGRISAVDLRSL